MRRWIGLVMVVLVAAGAVVALVGGGREGTGTGAATGAAKSAGERSASSSARPATPGANASAGSTDAFSGTSVASDAVVGSPVPAPTPGGPPVPGVTPRIARTAELHVRVVRKAIGARLGDAEGLAATMGGYVVRSESGAGFASITVRVPADRYDETLRRLGAMGKVSASTQSGTDRTAEYVDREARIRNLQAQEATLQDIMRQARTVPDTITVQQQLAAVQEQIEQLVSQQQLLDGETSFATISVSFTPTGAPPQRQVGAGGSALGRAWDDAVGALVAVVGGMIIVAGAVLPFAVLGLFGFLAWRALRRRPHLDGAGV
jgi:hypothetical protein